jgi:hypothetical protein
MKILICGSMTFAKEMLRTKERLGELGHEVQIPTDAQDVADGKHNHDDLEADYKLCVKTNMMREHFKSIEENDAILVLNHDKNGIQGYIGTASLMEMGLAYHLHKKIFLLQHLPHHSEQRWAHEVRIIQPIILNGDLTKIK